MRENTCEVVFCLLICIFAHSKAWCPLGVDVNAISLDNRSLMFYAALEQNLEISTEKFAHSHTHTRTHTRTHTHTHAHAHSHALAHMPHSHEHGYLY